MIAAQIRHLDEIIFNAINSENESVFNTNDT